MESVARAVADGGPVDLSAAATSVFEGCIAAIPYAPAAAFLGAEKAKLDSREGEVPRVAVMADGIASTHGVSRTIEEIRQRGVPGFEIEVVGTDPEVDRRLSAVAEIDVPFYPGLRIGVPSLPNMARAVSSSRRASVRRPDRRSTLPSSRRVLASSKGMGSR